MRPTTQKSPASCANSRAAVMRRADPAFALSQQPIRPVERHRYRCDRLPWYELLLRPLNGADPFAYVTAHYAQGDALLVDVAVLAAAAQAMRPHCHYSVNVSVEAVGSADLPATLLGLLGRHRVDPERLVLEIVGREFADPIMWRFAAANALRIHRQLRVAIALDDLELDDSIAGSLKCLVDLPVRYVKLSGVFTHAWLTGGAADLAPFVQRVLRFFGPATELVAEGIESPDLWRALVPATPLIAYWQGFFEDGQPTPVLSRRPALAA
jgi:EAL domain-containing protein (putative c-di-GMP-specific phosphodiesterase class I)